MLGFPVRNFGLESSVLDQIPRTERLSRQGVLVVASEPVEDGNSFERMTGSRHQGVFHYFQSKWANEPFWNSIGMVVFFVIGRHGLILLLMLNGINRHELPHQTTHQERMA